MLGKNGHISSFLSLPPYTTGRDVLDSKKHETLSSQLLLSLLNSHSSFASLFSSSASVQFDGIHVVSGSLDTSIRVWDVETGNCVHTLTGHQSLTSGMELKDNTLVSGNADSTVKIWDIKTGQCLQTLQGKEKRP